MSDMFKKGEYRPILDIHAMFSPRIFPITYGAVAPTPKNHSAVDYDIVLIFGSSNPDLPA